MAEWFQVAVCKTADAGSSPARTSIFGCGSMVELRTVNEAVAGSSPAIQTTSLFLRLNVGMVSHLDFR